MSFVQVISPCDPNAFHGSVDGYTYDFLQTIDNDHMLFSIKNPDNLTRVVEVDANGAKELRTNPCQFWIKYIH